MKYYQNKEDKTYMGKTGRKYRDLYYDAYKEYIRKVMDEKKKNDEKKHNSDETIKTRATDTFFLEKRETKPFLRWFDSDESLHEAKERLEFHLKDRQKFKSDVNAYFNDMLLFRDFYQEYCKNNPLDSNYSEEEKRKHANKISSSDLKNIAKKQSTKQPKMITSSTTSYYRDPYISEYAKRRAAGVCQLCGKLAPFERKNGEPYLETHHIVWLSEGGEDSIENTVALCPNCHRKMHVVNLQEDIDKLNRIANEIDNDGSK